MAQQPVNWTINCLVVDEPEPFSIEIDSNAKLSTLKQAIKGRKHPEFEGFAADSLVLFNFGIPTLQINKFHEQIAALDLPDKKMNALLTLSECYNGVPPDEHNIHILVQRPYIGTSGVKRKAEYSELSRKKKRASELISPDWTPREDAVLGLWELLQEYHLVQVRGPPASGKTTLMWLLSQHIKRERPNAIVHHQELWTESRLKSLDLQDRREQALPGYPDFDTDTYVLMDEGQVSYWDEDIWKDLKDRVQLSKKGIYLVVFCTYGNTHVRDNVPTPLDFGNAGVTLNRNKHVGSLKPFGLLLDKEEYLDVIKRNQKLHIDSDLRDFIYALTDGHIGTIHAIVNFVLIKAQSSMANSGPYSLEDFDKDCPSYDSLYRFLMGHRGVVNVLPTWIPEFAKAMRYLLREGRVLNGFDVDQSILTALKKGHKIGCVELGADQYFTFTSPLHRAIWSHVLLKDKDYNLSYQDVLSFSKAVISRFRPSQLGKADRRVGAKEHSSLEAQYKDEFYRCAHDLTDGNIEISPEFPAAVGARPGRIDFRIGEKKWGIEIVRDGSKLSEQASRFQGEGAYASWLEAGDIFDYILLDFRHTRPANSHPDVKGLYHVVFNDDQTEFTVYDNQMARQETQSLLQQQTCSTLGCC